MFKYFFEKNVKNVIDCENPVSKFLQKPLFWWLAVERCRPLFMHRTKRSASALRSRISEKAGPNPCPPIIVGVGIGGTFDKCAQLSKFALMRPVGSRHPDPAYAAMERELLDEINRMDIGPAGLGGRTTAMAVHIETYPTHIAGLPVAVNLCCHAYRHAHVVL